MKIPRPLFSFDRAANCTATNSLIGAYRCAVPCLKLFRRTEFHFERSLSEVETKDNPLRSQQNASLLLKVTPRTRPDVALMDNSCLKVNDLLRHY